MADGASGDGWVRCERGILDKKAHGLNYYTSVDLSFVLLTQVWKLIPPHQPEYWQKCL